MVGTDIDHKLRFESQFLPCFEKCIEPFSTMLISPQVQSGLAQRHFNYSFQHTREQQLMAATGSRVNAFAKIRRDTRLDIQETCSNFREFEKQPRQRNRGEYRHYPQTRYGPVAR